MFIPWTVILENTEILNVCHVSFLIMTWHHVTSALQGTLVCGDVSFSFIEFRVCLNYHRRFTLHVSSHTIQVWYIFTYIYHKNQPFMYQKKLYQSHGWYGHCYGFVSCCFHLGSKRTNGWRWPFAARSLEKKWRKWRRWRRWSTLKQRCRIWAVQYKNTHTVTCCR